MLQIKNTLGGGKPEGLYAWKKYEHIKNEQAETINESVGTLPIALYGGNAVVYNGEIHYIQSTYHYKYTNKQWESVSEVPITFSYGVMVVYDNKIHIINDTNHYAWDGSSWVPVSSPPFDLSFGGGIVYGDEIHVFGGSSSSNYRKHYAWNGTSWRNVSTLPYDFYSGSYAIYNNELHIMGSANTIDKHYKWNGSSWTSVATISWGTSNARAVVFEGKIHWLGGYSTNMHYTFDGSSWSVADNLPYDFGWGGAVVYDDCIYILGGGVTGEENPSTKNFYKVYGYLYSDNFLDYIVSDKETAYPDGGVKDGYWYEKVVEGLSLEVFGCTKYAVDEFSYASDTAVPGYNAKNTINHSLGVIPKFAFIIADYDAIPSGSTKILLTALTNITPSAWHTGYSYTFSESGAISWTESYMISGKSRATETTISLYNNSNQAYYYGAGIKYKVITMA